MTLNISGPYSRTAGTWPRAVVAGFASQPCCFCMRKPTEVDNSQFAVDHHRGFEAHGSGVMVERYLDTLKDTNNALGSQLPFIFYLQSKV